MVRGLGTVFGARTPHTLRRDSVACRGNTPLQQAAKWGCEKAVRSLLLAKASVDVQNEDGEGPRIPETNWLCIMIHLDHHPSTRQSCCRSNPWHSFSPPWSSNRSKKVLCGKSILAGCNSHAMRHLQSQICRTFASATVRNRPQLPATLRICSNCLQ